MTTEVRFPERIMLNVNEYEYQETANIWLTVGKEVLTVTKVWTDEQEPLFMTMDLEDATMIVKKLTNKDLIQKIQDAITEEVDYDL